MLSFPSSWPQRSLRKPSRTSQTPCKCGAGPSPSSLQGEPPDGRWARGQDRQRAPKSNRGPYRPGIAWSPGLGSGPKGRAVRAPRGGFHPSVLPPPSLNPCERAAAFRRWGPRGPEKTRLLLRGHICGVWGPQAQRRNFVSTRKGSGRCGDRGRGGEPGAWHAEAGPREPGGPAGVLSPGSPAAGKAARCAVVLGAGSPPTRFQDPEQQATRLRPRGRGPRRHRPPSPPRQLRRAAGPGHPGDAQMPGRSSLPAALATRGAGGAHGRGSAGTRRREPSADV